MLEHLARLWYGFWFMVKWGGVIAGAIFVLLVVIAILSIPIENYTRLDENDSMTASLFVLVGLAIAYFIGWAGSV